MPIRPKPPKNKLNRFFKYFGAKNSFSHWYPKPRWSTIIEPFAGSAAYSCCYPNRNVILYDINPRIFGIWDYLIKTTREEILSLPIDFEDVRELTYLPQEARWLIGFWVKIGQSEPALKPSKFWKNPRKRSLDFWCEVVRRRLSEQVEKIRHWKIYNKGYDSCPNQKATWFIDPPYQRSGKCYTFHDISYPYLGNWAKTRSGQVICCGQEGDNWVEFEEFGEIASCNIPTAPGTTKEVIYHINNF